MTRILNLTRHDATPEQRAAGVVEPRDKAAVRALLTFDGLPYAREISRRAAALATIAGEHGAVRALIGGASYLMGPLEAALRRRGVVPLHAFARREAIEWTTEDGGVSKTSVFRSAGLVTNDEREEEWRVST